ncbi:MAG: hypothetical protein JSU57_03955 [Candidatus Heimdallarchaeota archaeon]|nr:MAG: hypothetical protein JSU57_03955 [Candidatus Heimdallarchaeota archaeon]
MPTCQKCGAYYSEVSCPFCTPDDSPESPVTTIKAEESKSVRIIDPLELIESIEDIQGQLKTIQEEKELEIQKLTEDLAKQEEIDKKAKIELDELNSQVNELEASLKNQQERRQQLIQEKEKMEQEIEDLKRKFSGLKAEVSTREAEVSKLKEELGVL